MLLSFCLLSLLPVHVRGRLSGISLVFPFCSISQNLTVSFFFLFTTRAPKRFFSNRIQLHFHPCGFSVLFLYRQLYNL